VKETRADTNAAVVSALALHALLFALMFLGLWWTRASTPVSAAGPVIEADLVDPNALSAPMRRALDAPAKAPPPEPQPVQDATPPPQPVPEPTPQDAPVPPQPQAQEPVPEPDAREQQRVERDSEAAERAAREQEEKRRQEQIDLTERQRQDAAEKQRRLAQQQIADKLAKIDEADGTLLDHSLLLYGSNMGNPNQHLHYDVPHVLLGKNHGLMKGNRHIAYPSKTVSTGNLLLSLLDQYDIHQDSIGDSTGRLTSL